MKNKTLTTSTLVLAGLLCGASGAWADGRFDHNHGHYNRYSQQSNAGARQGAWWRGGYADAFGNVLQRVEQNKSKRGNLRMGTDRGDNNKPSNEGSHKTRRSYERSTPYRSQPRVGYDRNDNRRDERRDDRHFNRPGSSWADQRDNRRDDHRYDRSDNRRFDGRDNRRDDRRDNRRVYGTPSRVYQPLPPSQIYRRVPQQHERVYRDRDHNSYRAPSGWVLDRRYSHDHYYPPRGHVFERLPRDHHIVHYHGDRYYYWSGIWYRPSGVRFIVVSPPIGIVVPFLPLYYTTLWVSGIPYYYADGTYYRYSTADAGYVVVEAPGENTASAPVAPQKELYIYPAKGQSAQQQETDRYECHVWAVKQTDFDPTQPPTGLTQAQFAAQRTEYLRAMTACLEARGYTVK